MDHGPQHVSSLSYSKKRRRDTRTENPHQQSVLGRLSLACHDARYYEELRPSSSHLRQNWYRSLQDHVVASLGNHRPAHVLLRSTQFAQSRRVRAGDRGPCRGHRTNLDLQTSKDLPYMFSVCTGTACIRSKDDNLTAMRVGTYSEPRIGPRGQWMSSSLLTSPFDQSLLTSPCYHLIPAKRNYK
jgi:hypothetical protein